MTERLGDIIGKKYSAPDEFALIKKFVKDKFNSDCTVSQRDKDLIITVDNASLAGALRLELHNLKKQLKNDKNLIIRINS